MGQKSYSSSLRTFVDKTFQNNYKKNIVMNVISKYLSIK